MLQKLNSVHANNKSFLRPKNIHDTRFGIVHFAGEVYYQAEGELSSVYDPPGVTQSRIPARGWFFPLWVDLSALTKAIKMIPHR